MNDYDFQLAFSIESFENDHAEDLPLDPNFVEWVPYITDNNGDERSMIPVNYHRCTESDYQKFYPIDRAEISTLKKYKAKGLLCLDKVD